MVFGLFSKDKDKALQKTIERATNKLAQQPDRWKALEALKADGTEDALFGLCKRFGITSTKSVEDEEEKAWVVDTLVAEGPMAEKPIRRYLKSADHLSLPLKALGKIAPPPRLLEAIDELFSDEPPGYTRNPERKLDLLRWLGEWEAGAPGDVVSRVVPYLTDFDENVRFAAADAVAARGALQAGSALVAALTRPEEESGRVRRRLAEIIAEHKIPLGDAEARIAPLLTGPVAGFRTERGLLVTR